MKRYLIKKIGFIMCMIYFLLFLYGFFEVHNVKSLNIKPLTLNNTSLGVNVSDKISVFMKEQKHRQSIMHAACKQIYSHPIFWNSWLKNIFVDTHHNLTFCPVYKAASTSWFILLLQLNGKWNDRDLPRLLQIIKKTFLEIVDFQNPDLSKSSNRFIIVRHPFERLLSCYRDKYEGAKNGYYYAKYGEKMVDLYRIIPEAQNNLKTTLIRTANTYLKSGAIRTDIKLPHTLQGNPYASPFGPTFPEFTRFVLESTEEDNHWKPIYKLCYLCRIDYNFILKFENLYSESQSFIDHLNYSSIIKPRWENPTKGGNTGEDRTCDYFKQLSKDTVRGLIEKYRKDLAIFQYSPDKYLECADK
ncbi:unnamed protein product [Meganyctiphanes norvegica]|uniref:Carbohydrate sulfotransferase n=1 Tax=Meganyctiphanes norvegica TaxID=48144 RepID=A0AAV2PTP0_MEGNR